MSRTPRRRLAPIFGLVVLAASQLAAREPERPDLSGHWLLEPRGAGGREGDPRDRSAAGERRAPGERAGRRPTGSGEGDPAAFRERMAGLERAAAELEIRAVEGGFVLRDGAGKEWPLLPGSLEKAVAGADGVETYVRSEWQEDGSLRFWRVRAAMPTVVETLALDAESDTLTIETTFSDRSRGDRTLRRVYRREAAPVGPTTPPPDAPSERDDAGGA